VLQGYHAWREVMKHHGGFLKCDMVARKLVFAETEAELA